MLYKVLYVLLLIVMGSGVCCTEMQIMANPTSEQLYHLNLMKSLRRCRERSLNIRNETYTCVTAIKQKHSTNTNTNINTNINNNDKLKSLHINGNIPTNTQLDASQLEYNKLDLLMDNVGVKQYTK